MSGHARDCEADMREYNKLTKELLAEGYSAECHPDYVMVGSTCPDKDNPLSNLDGGFVYVRSHIRKMTFRTPCGLQCRGESCMSSLELEGIEWTFENDMATVQCPYRIAVCEDKHESLPCTGVIKTWCNVHQVDEPYQYENSLEQVEELEEKIEDIAGIRLICQFVEDINAVVEIIRNRKDLEIKQEKDYITQSKPSGYRSYHIIVYYTVHTINGPKRLEVEIQIRTMAMNFWSTIEHSLQYKYKEHMPDELRMRLLRVADAVDALDNEMASVRDEIMDAQNSNRQKATIISDILNNIDNLYYVANEREVTKIQNEFFKIYQKDDMEMLMRFNKQLDIIAETYRAQSVAGNIL